MRASREPRSNGSGTQPIGEAPSARASGYRLLADSQLEEMHLAALEILRRTGVRVYEPEVVAMLGDAGCSVTDTSLVRFPPAVIEDALRWAPSRVPLCDRTGQARVLLEAHRTYFGTGSDLPNTRDLETGERRLSRLSDVRDTARLADALPNLDFIMSMALPSDVPSTTSDRHAFRAMIENTAKPVVFTAWDESGIDDILAMAECVAGGRDELRMKPFLLGYFEPTSPLQHFDVVLRKLLRMVDRGLPVVYAPGAVDGASAPVTGAGSLALGTAEVLSGLAIAQLRRRGTPFVLGSGSGPLDMRTLVATYVSPEFMRHTMAIAELAHHYYRLPVWGFGGCSDSKLPDMQAGIDSTLWTLCAALSGANLVHDVGYIESGLTCSYEMIVVSDEIIGFVRRLLAGFRIDAETLALDTIHEIGPKADYVTAKHTTRHYREVWYPRVLDRRGHGAWVSAGRPTAVETARAIARETIANHVPAPLPNGAGETLAAIIAEADARAAAEAPASGG
ncbi:MAG: trimethylamine methyltransferase family protein [Myxococcales bacterium]|nr:trimethylamine methyltransferase family protein [Myxococcales bacterium]MDH5307498.1 trimethylamine methyltransferase family protein [Myxococcales bacterium]MDH5565960.1 trimethylamine methyltransferase family protein [Myxococcales bacterium]